MQEEWPAEGNADQVDSSEPSRNAVRDNKHAEPSLEGSDHLEAGRFSDLKNFTCSSLSWGCNLNLAFLPEIGAFNFYLRDQQDQVAVPGGKLHFNPPNFLQA